MIFAAGLGTRLRPLTDRTPKALIEVGGAAVLERVARRLVAAGADRLVINAHGYADTIERFVASRHGFGVDVRISREEPAPLETGGGLRLAAPLLRGEAPFFLHNVDVLSDIDLRTLYAAHIERGPLATLAVMRRESPRQLLFDEGGLFGRVDTRSSLSTRVREPLGPVRELAFCGIHVADPLLPSLLTESGAFSVIDAYVRLARAGERILPFVADGAAWADIGSARRLEEARTRFG